MQKERKKDEKVRKTALNLQLRNQFIQSLLNLEMKKLWLIEKSRIFSYKVGTHNPSKPFIRSVSTAIQIFAKQNII